MLFSEGTIEGITATALKNFVASRLNICLGNLDIEPLFEVETNTVGEWFYKDINMVKLNDFFTGIDSSYNRDWDTEGFTWKI